jgi:hypothetical protein
MAMPKKKTTIKKTAPKTAPKKKIGKDLTDVIGSTGGRNTVYKDKEGNTRITNMRKENYITDVITVSKQGKSGFSTVKEKSGTAWKKNNALKGRVAPVANPVKAAEGLRQTSDYLRNRKSSKKKGK